MDSQRLPEQYSVAKAQLLSALKALILRAYACGLDGPKGGTVNDLMLICDDAAKLLDLKLDADAKKHAKEAKEAKEFDDAATALSLGIVKIRHDNGSKCLEVKAKWLEGFWENELLAKTAIKAIRWSSEE